MLKSLSLNFLIISLSFVAEASHWQMGYGMGSYLGKSQIVGTWLSEEKNHELNFSLGFTQDSGVGPIWQYSLFYLYPTFDPRPLDGGDVLWNPFFIGGFITYTDNTNFYVDTEGPYPQDRYYDVTSIRWGLRMSSQIQNIEWSDKTFQVSIEGSLLDRAFNNYFNNPDVPDIFKYYWSLGLILKMNL